MLLRRQLRFVGLKSHTFGRSTISMKISRLVFVLITRTTKEEGSPLFHIFGQQSDKLVDVESYLL